MGGAPAEPSLGRFSDSRFPFPAADVITADMGGEHEDWIAYPMLTARKTTARMRALQAAAPIPAFMASSMLSKNRSVARIKATIGLHFLLEHTFRTAARR